MPASSRDLAFSAAAAALGAWAMYKTQTVSKETFDPIVAACTAAASGEGSTAPSDVELLPFEAYLGLGMGPFVCIITQFLHKLTQSAPAGMIMWVLTFLASFPAGVIMTAEGGRSGARGIIRYPTFIGLLMQLIGISVAFPLVWVPGCILFGSRDGSVLPRRMYAGTLLYLPGMVLTSLVFRLDAASYAWRVCAGMLGGPILPLFSLSLWRMHIPEGDGRATDPEARAAGASATARAHLVSCAVCLVGWAAVVGTACASYGLDVFAVWADVWTDADGAVRFMTVDAGVLFLAVLTYIAWRSVIDAVAALAMSPLLGPGAACSLVLWGREHIHMKVAEATGKEKAA